MIKEVESIIKDEIVIVPLQEDADFLIDGGYGTPREGELGSTLSPYEALYLLFDKRIKITDSENGDILDFRSLLKRYRVNDAEAWNKYLVYRDLRGRGYVVREGFGLGINFRVYERGTYGEQVAKYIVFAICEGNPIQTVKLFDALRLAQSVKKELILAVMDRRGEVVYYSIQSLTLLSS